MKTKCRVGTYAIDPSVLVWKDANTAHIYDKNHCGVMVKFVGGVVPNQGDPVLVTSVLDACLERGRDSHRPGVKRIIRVKKIEPRDGRPLCPIEVVRHNGLNVPGGWHLNAEWALVTRREDEELAVVPLMPAWRLLGDGDYGG